MKVSELEGEMLDYWAGKATGHKVQLTESGAFCEYWEQHANGEDLQNWSPSTDWAQGGPLMEQYAIMACHDNPEGTRWFADVGGYMSHDYVSGPERHSSGYGPTPLIAAMRALVVSKFGEEVSDE